MPATSSTAPRGELGEIPQLEHAALDHWAQVEFPHQPVRESEAELEPTQGAILPRS